VDYFAYGCNLDTGIPDIHIDAVMFVLDFREEERGERKLNSDSAVVVIKE
jgi:hypothetical protein